MLTIWVLSVQLWTDPPPKIAIIYSKEFSSREECLKEKQKWENKEFTSLCLFKTQSTNSIKGNK